MRVPVVIALILAGIGALYFALIGGGSSDPDVGVAQPGAVASSGSSGLVQGGGAQVEEARPAQPTERTEATLVRQDADRETVATGGSWGTAIEGTIVSPDGAPVEGATVMLRDDNAFGTAGNLAPFLALAGATQQEAETWSTASDVEGRFLFTGIEPGDSYTLLVETENFARKEVPMVAVADGETTREQIVLDEGFVVMGYIRDVSNGTLLMDAEVVMVPLTFAQFPEDDPQYLSRVRTATSKEDGYYRFDNVSPDMYQLTARAEGYGSVTMNDVQVLAQNKKRSIKKDFNLEVGAMIAGFVFDQDGRPLEGARVIAMSQGGQKTSRGSFVTGADGAFQLLDLIPGTYTVVGAKKGYEEDRNQRVDTGTNDVQFELIQQGGLEGQVVGPTGSPLPNFSVSLRMLNQHTNVPGRAMRNQDVRGSSNGGFQFGGVPDGTYVVEANAPDFAPTTSERFEVTKGTRASGIVVQMNYGGSISGVVVDASTGEPVAGARITTHDNTRVRTQLNGILGMLMPRTTTERSVRSNADGTFLLELLSPDIYQIEVEHRDYYSVVEYDVRVLAAPEPTEVGRIEMSPGGTVAGTVYDQTGQPLGGGKVTLSGNPDAIGLSYEVRTGSDGRYRIDNVFPGNYQLHAQRPLGSGGSPFDVVVDIQNSKVSVFLREGAEVRMDLNLGT